MKKKEAPKISIIIPVEPAGNPQRALNALRRLDYPGNKMEVLVSRGRQPSLQRNQAAKTARGDFLLFLDSDSAARPDLANKLLGCFEQGRVAAAGGPNLPAEPQSRRQRAFSMVLGSWFGSMAARARYKAIGQPRESSEKELILCNLMMRKDVFLKAGGFKAELYPNEENELMNRLQGQGYILRYHPWACVERPRREKIRAFIIQAFRYGRGRMQQIWLLPQASDLVHLLPALFVFYLLLIFPFAFQHAWLALPACLYLAFDLIFSFLESFRHKNVAYAPFLVPLFMCRHVAYGIGLIWGLFKRPHGPLPSNVKVQRVQLKREHA